MIYPSIFLSPHHQSVFGAIDRIDYFPFQCFAVIRYRDMAAAARALNHCAFAPMVLSGQALTVSRVETMAASVVSDDAVGAVSTAAVSHVMTVTSMPSVAATDATVAVSHPHPDVKTVSLTVSPDNSMSAAAASADVAVANTAAVSAVASSAVPSGIAWSDSGQVFTDSLVSKC